MLVRQPTAAPTRKLSAATLAAALMAVAGLVVRNFWPDWFDAGAWAAMTPVVAFAIGYIVHDRPNDGGL